MILATIQALKNRTSACFLIAAAAVVTFLGWRPAYAAPSVYTGSGKSIYVVDGDTFILLYGVNQKQKVRLAQIDAPEHQQAFGKRSRQSLSELLYGKEIMLNCPSIDDFDRWVCDIESAGVNINLQQVVRGMAWAYPQYVRDENFFRVEREARSTRRGLWIDPVPMAPWEFRRKNKKRHSFN